MKKIVALFIVTTLLLTIGCTTKRNEVSNDEKKFKEEYESINGKKQGNSKIMSISVDDENKMKYIDSTEVIQILEGKTGVIYFGFPNCPWCRNIVPILINAAKETDLDVIYYANLVTERDKKELNEEGEVVTIEEGSENYKKIVELLKEYLGVYEGLGKDEIKRLYFPTVLFVKNGKVESIHIGTLDSQKDPYKKLEKEQQKELMNIYMKGITKIQNLTCDTDKTC